MPRDCASPSSTFKGVQPHAATSLASGRLDLDLWTLLRRDAFLFFTQVVINGNAKTLLPPPPCTARKRSPDGCIHHFSISFPISTFFIPPSPSAAPGPANGWGSVVGAADRRDRPPLMYPGDEARSAPRRLHSPVEVGSLSHHLQGFQNIPGGWEWDF